MNQSKRNNSVIFLKDYGHIELRLKKIMDEKKISKYSMARMTDLRYEVVSRYYEQKIERIDLDIISRFCYILNCEINDLLEYHK